MNYGPNSPNSPVFTITYWGTTGSFCAPLLPQDVSRKISRAVAMLVEKGVLQGLRPNPNLESEIIGLMERYLPFHLRSSYGGNTTCLEVETPDALIILDCGSGFRELGVSLAARWRADGRTDEHHAHVLLTHAHMDHTFGTPFFAPYYNPSNVFELYGPQTALDSLAAVLSPKSALSGIYFPPSYADMQAIKAMHTLDAKSDFAIGSTRITTYSLNHPGGCLAYRFENAGKVFVFTTDHEHAQVPDRELAAFAQDADLLYMDGQYTHAEYLGEAEIAGDPPMTRRGWGHSPVEDCVATAVAAGARALHIGHGEPRRSDEETETVEAYLRRLVPEQLARSGRPSNAMDALIPFEGMQWRI